MFVDAAKIVVQAGKGGKGCESFYYDRYRRRHPNGGDGGNGGNVIFKINPHASSLKSFQNNKKYKAQDGSPGSAHKKKGKNGSDLIIHIPKGTILKDAETKRITASHQQVLKGL